MQTITSFEAKALIPSVTREEAIQYLISVNEDTDDLSVNCFYLGSMCARGKLNDAAAFIKSLGAGATEVINLIHSRFYWGTVLHVALYWNSGQLGLDFFELLWEHGARYCPNYYENYPWEQLDEMWVNPVRHGPDTVLGTRDITEFIDMYEQIRETYDLPSYAPNP
jgi:hypothetical protein